MIKATAKFNFLPYEEVKDHIGNIDAETYNKIVARTTGADVPDVTVNPYINPFSGDPADTLTYEEATVMAVEFSRTPSEPVFVPYRRTVIPATDGTADEPVANANVADAEAANAEAGNEPVTDANVADANVVNAQAPVQAPPMVIMEFDDDFELPTRRRNAILPMDFGDLIGAAHNKCMAAHADAQDALQNGLQPIPPKDFLTYVHECAVGNLEPQQSAAQRAIDEAAGVDRTIYQHPNSAYPTTTVPTMSFDELVARNGSGGSSSDPHRSRDPDGPLDITTVLAQNRMELARCKEREVRRLQMSIAKYRRDNDLDRVPMFDILSHTPDRSTMPQQASSNPAADLQTYLVEQQQLANIPDDRLQPMNGPNAMADPSYNGPMRADTAWSLSVNANDDETVEVEMQTVERPRIAGPRRGASILGYVNQVAARHATLRRAVDLVPAVTPVEGDLLLGRPRYEDELQSGRPTDLGDQWESDSDIGLDWAEDGEDEEDDEEDVEMADQ